MRLWVEPETAGFLGGVGERGWALGNGQRSAVTEMLRLEHWLDGMEVIMVVSPTFLALLFRVNRIPDNVWK